MITKASPAKVNLQLRVLRRREDGYHDILSLMQRISLCDEMTFGEAPGGIVVRCPDSNLPEDRRNIVYRAASVFLLRKGAPPGIEITIRKRIPLASGLGGGSSNAATTLMTLNEMSGRPLTRDELMKLGTDLGADVPFFIFEKTAWASGIGDQFVEAAPLPKLWFVLVNPGFSVSTKMVYEGLNLGLTNRTNNYSIPRFYTVEDLIRGLVNDLETVTVRHHPVLDHCKTLLLQNGAHGALMSGSGPTVFGIFSDEDSALKAETNLRRGNNQWSVFSAHSL
jgi:4-diphosphocytidyl-2-C-methyl-D-erythritol kinase